MWFRIKIIFLSCCFPFCLAAQQTPWKNVPVDSLKDLTDVIHNIFNKNSKNNTQDRMKNPVQIGVFPAIGYTLQTGFAVVVSANAQFYTSPKQAGDSNLLPSTISVSASYTQKSQTIVPIQGLLYFNHNKTMVVSDFRYLKYPSYTYGLGMSSSPQDSLLLTYQYLKIHQSVLFQVYPHVYIGPGYDLDWFTNLGQKYPGTQLPNDFETYGYKPTSFNSAISFNFLRDTRDNTITSYKGSYLSLIVSPRAQFLGSNTNWTSMLLEYRTYIRFPKNSPNILALWSYNWLTLSGNPPYLMLPSTAWDRTFNTGRGYIQGRFRSNNMLDGEAEYRIQLTRNGLFGMVVFGNLQTFSTINTWVFGAPAPGGGLGLRIKLNKFSRTNIAIDYGWGRQGSSGFFVNLGEAF